MAGAVLPREARSDAAAVCHVTLAEAGDLWLRLGRPEGEGASLLAAARHVETTPLDLASLAREGNLGVVGWLSPLARSLVDRRVAEGRTTMVDELRAELLAPEAAAS